jgi:hypothetical protein
MKRLFTYDGDVIILKPLDELFDAIRSNDFAGVATLHNSTSNPDRIDFLFTRDYVQMSKLATDPTKFGVQGGFFVVRPNTTIFSEMIRVDTSRGISDDLVGVRYDMEAPARAPQIPGLPELLLRRILSQQCSRSREPCIYNTLQTLAGCPNGTNSLITTCPRFHPDKFFGCEVDTFYHLL